ncbi:MAG: hypothetical protein ABJ327_11170 [Litoreibacter sp.]
MIKEFSKLVTDVDDTSTVKSKTAKMRDLADFTEEICKCFIKEKLLQISEELNLMGFSAQVLEDPNGDLFIDLTSNMRIIFGINSTIFHGREILMTENGFENEDSHERDVLINTDELRKKELDEKNNPSAFTIPDDRQS